MRRARRGASRRGRSPRRPSRPVVTFVEKNLDAAARFLLLRCPASRRGGTIAAQAVQDTLDVLAGAQTVGAMVPAPARVDVRAERTDLHRVAAAVRCGDLVVAEGARTPVERVQVDDLGPSAPLPASDLSLIGREPSPERGRPVILQAPASGGGFPSWLVHVAFRGVSRGGRS